MAVALDKPVQEASNKPFRSRAAWLMTFGFLVYTLLILVGHIVGFQLGYAYLHTVCPHSCGLTPGNVHALENHGLSIAFYANFYMAIQLLYILVSVGIALLIVFKRPGKWAPLGVSCFLLGFSAFEGVDYPALAASYPILNIPAQLLISLGMSALGMYALLTFPNGKFGSRWVLGYFLLQFIVAVLSAFITNPVFVQFNNIFALLSFPIILGVLIYRYRRLLNARERSAIRWLILSFSVFIPTLVAYDIVLAVTPADSLVFLLVNTIGFFGCGINIAGFLMAVLYANAFDIDIFVRRTLVYTMLTAILALLYAALFQPLRHRLQQTIDRRFYRSRYDAHKIVVAFSSTLRQVVDLDTLHEQLLAVVQEKMQPAHVSLWLRPPAHGGKQRVLWRATPPASSGGIEE